MFIRSTRVALAAGWIAAFGCNSPPAPTTTPQAPSRPAPTAEASPPTNTSPPSPLPESEWIEPGERADFCPAVLEGPPIAPAAKPRRIKDGFVFLEGPVWVESLGALLFSEMDFTANGENGPPSKVHRLVPPSTFDVFLESSGSNGLGVDAGGLLVCAHDDQSVSRVDLETKARSTIVANVDGKRFNSPNDLVRRSTGEIYFTDPDWQLGKRRSETGVTGVYFVDRDGVARAFDTSLDKPNGITLSPDERTLYVGAADGVVYRYRLTNDGTPKDKERFADVPEPDGMAMDCAGNLYATSHGPGLLKVIAPSGELVASVEVGPRATNAAFGGADHKTLYITAGTALYALAAQVPGFAY